MEDNRTQLIEQQINENVDLIAEIKTAGETLGEPMSGDEFLGWLATL